MPCPHQGTAEARCVWAWSVLSGQRLTAPSQRKLGFSKLEVHLKSKPLFGWMASERGLGPPDTWSITLCNTVCVNVGSSVWAAVFWGLSFSVKCHSYTTMLLEKYHKVASQEQRVKQQVHLLLAKQISQVQNFYKSQVSRYIHFINRRKVKIINSILLTQKIGNLWKVIKNVFLSHEQKQGYCIYPSKCTLMHFG